MPHVLSPILLYVGCAVGALGVLLALPRAKWSLFPVGALVAGAGFGLVMVTLGVSHPDAIPNYHFYIFSALALGAALRVISHPRPVYAALYFILTIIASAGLYLILSAEFMSFALIIVYAGAILITYLFVIMLATESPSEEQPDALNEYDRVSREPVGAVLAGFVLLAALTTLFSSGAGTLSSAGAARLDDQRLVVMGKKVEGSLRRAGLMGPEDSVVRKVNAAGKSVLDMDVGAGVIRVQKIGIDGKNGPVVEIKREQWPADLAVSNTEAIGHTLIEEHPGSIEIAGVILLMAMLGAVVLARKKVEMDEASKASAAQRVRERDLDVGNPLGTEGAFATPGVGEGGQA